MKYLFLFIQLFVAKFIFADDLPVETRGYGIIQLAFNNGRGHMVTYANGRKTGKSSGYYQGTSLMLGFGSKKGVCITTGVRHKIYFQTMSDATPWNPMDAQHLLHVNYFVFSVPLMLDYKLSILKQALFWTVGAGVEVNRVYRQKANALGTVYDQPLEEAFSNFVSFTVVGRTGPMFSLTKHFDIFADFYFERNISSLYRYAGVTPVNVKFLPYSLSLETGVNFKF
jgi:hypothetical protein